MSTSEKTRMDTDTESNDGSDVEYQWSDDDGQLLDIVLALPALRVSTPLAPPEVDENTRTEAVVSAGLVAEPPLEDDANTQCEAAAQDAVAVKGKIKRKKILKPDVDPLDGSSGSAPAVSSGDAETAKKMKKKGSSKLTNPPQGPPVCNVCGKGFISWKAVFGHLRAHKDRGYVGYLPPPVFNAAQEGFGGVAAVAASGGGGMSGFGTGGLNIDLNADPTENEEEETGSDSAPIFDLNRSPPQDDEEEKEDKAE